jgi:hypothetical protein
MKRGTVEDLIGIESDSPPNHAKGNAALAGLRHPPGRGYAGALLKLLSIDQLIAGV